MAHPTSRMRKLERCIRNLKLCTHSEHEREGGNTVYMMKKGSVERSQGMGINDKVNRVGKITYLVGCDDQVVEARLVGPHWTMKVPWSREEAFAETSSWLGSALLGFVEQGWIDGLVRPCNWEKLSFDDAQTFHENTRKSLPASNLQLCFDCYPLPFLFK